MHLFLHFIIIVYRRLGVEHVYQKLVFSFIFVCMWVSCMGTWEYVVITEIELEKLCYKRLLPRVCC